MGFHHGARKTRRRGKPLPTAGITREVRAAMERLDPCPDCKATVGDPCRDPSGNTLTNGGSHAARRALANLKVDR